MLDTSLKVGVCGCDEQAKEDRLRIFPSRASRRCPPRHAAIRKKSGSLYVKAARIIPRSTHLAVACDDRDVGDVECIANYACDNFQGSGSNYQHNNSTYILAFASTSHADRSNFEPLAPVFRKRPVSSQTRAIVDSLRRLLR